MFFTGKRPGAHCRDVFPESVLHGLRSGHEIGHELRNPAAEAQAIDRSHRIGQTQNVIAYRLISPGSVEEKIWDLQQRKSQTIADVLGEEGFAKSLSETDLEYLFSED